MRSAKAILVIFISVVTLLKLLLLWWFDPAIHLWEDHDIAINICSTGEFFIFWDGINNHTFQFPVYPFLVSVLYRLFGVKPFAVAVFQVVVSGLSAFLLSDIFHFFIEQFRLPESLKQYRYKIIFLAVAAFLFHPAINYYALCNVHPFTLDLLMLLLPLYFTAIYIRSLSKWSLVLLFISSGLAVLTRSTLIVSVVPFLLFIYNRQGIKKTMFALAGLIFCIAIICAPWLIRNHRVDGISGLTSSMGKILWKGSLPGSEGSNYLHNGKDYYTTLTEPDLDTLNHLSVNQQNNFFAEKYLNLLYAHPADVTRLYFIKLKNFWLFRDQLGNEYSMKVQQLIPFYKAGYLLVLIFCCMATILIGRRSLYLLCLPVVLSLVQSVFYVETRHRIIIEPLLIFMAVIGLLFIWQKLFRREQ